MTDARIPDLVLDVTMRDGKVHRITVENPALVNYEIQAVNERWPGPEQAPLLWQTSIAFWQMRDEGLLHDAPSVGKQWEQFRSKDCRKVDQVKVDTGADPTPATDESGSVTDSPSLPAGPSSDSSLHRIGN